MSQSHCTIADFEIQLFPYVTSDYRFIGLAYEWEFEARCWVVSHLSKVTQRYRAEYFKTYDQLFALFQNEFENYAFHSERMRKYFLAQRRRITLLHRNGGYYLLSPGSEQLRRIYAKQLPRFGPY
jgi:hypothetical protein